MNGVILYNIIYIDYILLRAQYGTKLLDNNNDDDNEMKSIKIENSKMKNISFSFYLYTKLTI